MVKNILVVALLAIGLTTCFAQKTPPVRRQQPRIARPVAPPRSTWPLEAANTVGSYLLARKDVQTELKLTADAASKVDGICAKLKSDIAEIKAQGKPVKGQARRSGREAYEEANKALHELLDQTQYARLRAINLQDLSFNAYFYVDVQEELGMAADERAKLNALEVDRAAKMKQINQDFKANKLTKDQRKAEVQALTKDVRQQVLAIVTKEQQAKLEQIEAPKFKFSHAK